MAKLFPETLRSVSITGNLMPVYLDGQPVLIQMPNETAFFVVVFTDEEKLRRQMALLAPGQQYKIKHIDDGREFCESVWENSVRIMLDPHIVEGCKTRWTEIMQG